MKQFKQHRKGEQYNEPEGQVHAQYDVGSDIHEASLINTVQKLKPSLRGAKRSGATKPACQIWQCKGGQAISSIKRIASLLSTGSPSVRNDVVLDIQFSFYSFSDTIIFIGGSVF